MVLHMIFVNVKFAHIFQFAFFGQLGNNIKIVFQWVHNFQFTNLLAVKGNMYKYSVNEIKS